MHLQHLEEPVLELGGPDSLPALPVRARLAGRALQFLPAALTIAPSAPSIAPSPTGRDRFGTPQGRERLLLGAGTARAGPGAEQEQEREGEEGQRKRKRKGKGKERSGKQRKRSRGGAAAAPTPRGSPARAAAVPVPPFRSPQDFPFPNLRQVEEEAARRRKMPQDPQAGKELIGEQGGQIPTAEPLGRGRFERLHRTGIQWGGKVPEISHKEGLQTWITGI
ncbi:uncharacterized protein LOC134428234 [Melospiza melodia melodia]|uniref:uncharacterized protein LOC134428234 n=1 Tax=Melospiza melodia melodia TaxID=1914991 RepID=UPI002FD69108